MFHPIVLLNMLGKLIKKIIGEYLQFHAILTFIHPNQLGNLKQQSTTDTGTFLIYLVWSEWVKNLQISTLTFDITQFFLLLNHWLLPILDKVNFDSKISNFFSDYLIGRKTQYLWNSFTSLFLCVDVKVGQESAFSSILSILYLSSVFHIFEKETKDLHIPISFFSFIDIWKDELTSFL